MITLIGEIFIGIMAVLGSLYIFLEFVDEIAENEIVTFDTIITNFIISFRSPEMTEVMKWITFLGGQYFLTGAIILTILLLWRKHRKDAFLFGFIFLFGVGLNFLLKEIFQRARPIDSLITELHYSFPSGHAMNSTVFYIALCYFIFRNIKNRTWGFVWTLLAGIVVVLICISRVYLGVHYPSDVIAGVVAGLCWFALVLLVEKTILFFRLFKKYEIEKKY